MIIYDSKIARLLQGRLNPYDYVTLPLVTLTALPYCRPALCRRMDLTGGTESGPRRRTGGNRPHSGGKGKTAASQDP